MWLRMCVWGGGVGIRSIEEGEKGVNYVNPLANKESLEQVFKVELWFTDVVPTCINP